MSWFSVVIFAVCLVTVDCAGKYPKDKNNDWHEDESYQFRSKKVNQLWEKAKKRLSGPRLADMYADLRLQDKYEMDLKRIIADDLDKDGLKEADVRMKFRNIVKKYNLLEQFKDIEPQGSNEIPMENNFEKMIEFGDLKLQKLWNKAAVAGFNDDELEKLKTEFWHQQMKVDEYQTLRDQLTDVHYVSENSIDRVKQGFDPSTMKEKHQDLKSKHRKVKDGYLRLESLATKTDAEFSDPRVYQLWALAQQSNMSTDELNSFHTELKHFEHRIGKHQYMKDQVFMSKHELRDKMENGQYPEKHTKLQETAENYGKKVKKLHAELKRQVERALGHTEL